MNLTALTLWCLAGAAALLPACGPGEEERGHQAAEPTASSDPWIQAEEIWALYNASREQADERFKEKLVTVTGRVTDVQPEPDLSFVALESGDPNAEDSSAGLVLCMFPSSVGAELAEVQVGDRAIIRGRVDGFGGPGFPVFIDDCSLVVE